MHSTGALEVTDREGLYFHASQWTHHSGTGEFVDDEKYDADPDAGTKVQGKGRRWAYLPWTREQEESCRGFTVRMRFWNGAGGYGVLDGVEEEREMEEMMEKGDAGMVREMDGGGRTRKRRAKSVRREPERVVKKRKVRYAS